MIFWMSVTAIGFTSGEGYPSGATPSLKYVLSVAVEPSPHDHENVRSSLPGSDAWASNPIGKPTRYARRSATVHVHVSGWRTLNVW